MVSTLPLCVCKSPLSETHLIIAPGFLPLVNVVVWLVLFHKTFWLTIIAYISYMLVYSGLKWSRCLKKQKSVYILPKRAVLDVSTIPMWLFLSYARLFLTHGHKHEQCHGVDSLTLFDRLQRKNCFLSFNISAACSLRKKTSNEHCSHWGV